MKTIRLALNKEFEEIEDIVSSIKKCELEIIEDDNSLESLRFVLLDVENIMIDLTYDGVTFRNLTKPHLFTTIKNEYLYNIDIRY